MKIAIFGATGDTGRCICRRAIDEGYTIKPFSFRRTEIVGVDTVEATPIDLNQVDLVTQAIDGVDAIISAIGGETSSRYTGITSLIEAANHHQIKRLIAIGGAGILDLPTGGKLKDQPFFPEFLKPITDAHQASLECLQRSSLSWTMICPGTMKEGHSDGTYRHQGDEKLADMASVLYDDVAHLIIKSLQDNLYVHQRVSISNP